MLGQEPIFSSSNVEWGTPPHIFSKYDAVYHFTLDVCATHENALCEHYYTKEQNGLVQDWHGRCWMNPPYGRQIGKWMRKAYESSLNGTTVVCLVPARTDTAWWHDWATKGRIEFIRGRLKYVGGKNRAPFPSAIIIYEPKKED